MSDRAARMRCLVIGDVIGKPGRLALEHALADLRSELNVDFVIANGENLAAGAGLTPSLAEGLLETGVDVIELLQPDLFGVDNLARDFGGKVCFCCSVDHQRRAIHGDRDEIFAYARHLRDALGAFNGGFIGYVEDYASLGMTERNYLWIREAFHTLDAPAPARSERTAG